MKASFLLGALSLISAVAAAPAEELSERAGIYKSGAYVIARKAKRVAYPRYCPSQKCKIQKVKALRLTSSLKSSAKAVTCQYLSDEGKMYFKAWDSGLYYSELDVAGVFVTEKGFHNSYDTERSRLMDLPLCKLSLTMKAKGGQSLGTVKVKKKGKSGKKGKTEKKKKKTVTKTTTPGKCMKVPQYRVETGKGGGLFVTHRITWYPKVGKVSIPKEQRHTVSYCRAYGDTKCTKKLDYNIKYGESGSDYPGNVFGFKCW